MRNFILAAIVLTVACSSGNKAEKATPQPTVVDHAIEINADLSVDKLHEILVSGKDINLIDVRTKPEYDIAHLKEIDLQIPHDKIVPAADSLLPDKSAELFIICRSGRRSGIASEILRKIGYENVHNVTGGIIAWQAAGYPVVSEK